jgi:UDP-N-acetylglucosamine 2-epimerase (non-hydrolysing)
VIKKKKIMLVFGTRPEAIKMAPLVLKLREEPESFDVQVCVTAQHRQMLDQVLKVFEIVPDIDLNIMKPVQDLFDLTANILQGMRGVFQSDRPHAVLVHGDTTTALATAMAGFYAEVPVGHVEAGLRTCDIYRPFPEEFNRQVVSKIARWHFCPTELSRSNLIAERVSENSITVTGNTVIDSLHLVLNRIEADDMRSARLTDFINETLLFDWKSDKFVLITGHRRENFGEGFLQICEALRELAMRYQDIHFVYPVHLNPNVQEPVRSILSNLSNVHLIEPLDYEPFIYLLKFSYIVLTDSGGIQEEVPSLGKPVLVMRDVTERPEAVQAGTVELVGANKERIVAGVSRLLEDDYLYSKMSLAHNPYGNGTACEQILKVLRNI